MNINPSLSGILSVRQHLKSLKKLLSTPVLAYLRTDCKFILVTGGSVKYAAGILSQDGAERVIVYMRKAMNKQYCITTKELTALVLALKHFHY